MEKNLYSCELIHNVILPRLQDLEKEARKALKEKEEDRYFTIIECMSIISGVSVKTVESNLIYGMGVSFYAKEE